MSSAPPLVICGLIHSPGLVDQIAGQFQNSAEQFQWQPFSNNSEITAYLDQHRHQVDCLILEWDPDLRQLIQYLHHSAITLPAVLLAPHTELLPQDPPHYHAAEVILNQAAPEEIFAALNTAITHFLKLSQACLLPLPPDFNLTTVPEEHTSRQAILSERLKERLGYLGVYYKRDSDQFFRHMPATVKEEFLCELRTDYRAIILEYFRPNNHVNRLIDTFVSKAFFADISVSQVLEIHIELMDDFAKQLKLEGRNEDILLDYRLALIDVIAHLCEMYRRSIPRKA